MVFQPEVVQNLPFGKYIDVVPDRLVFIEPLPLHPYLHEDILKYVFGGLLILQHPFRKLEVKGVVAMKDNFIAAHLTSLQLADQYLFFGRPRRVSSILLHKFNSNSLRSFTRSSKIRCIAGLFPFHKLFFRISYISLNADAIAGENWPDSMNGITGEVIKL